MDKNAQLNAEIRAWLNRVMKEKGLSVTEWARKADVARTTIARPLKEDYPNVVSSRTLAHLAEAAGVAAPDLKVSRDAKLLPLFLPVRYKVQAGHWIEIDEQVQDWEGPENPVVPDRRFKDYEQWLERVVGDSIDRRIPDGSFAHVVNAIDMGYTPRRGDLVVVERRPNQHQRQNSTR